MQSEQLIQSLIEQTMQNINQVEKLKSYELQTLNWKQDTESWSILECIEHLNLYGKFYLPQIENKIENSHTTRIEEFRSGILGNYFSKSMLPKKRLDKMKTSKDKNPLHAKLDKSTIEYFINQQIKTIDLLDKSRNIDINKVKIETSISSFIKLKLGDTFLFLTNHIIRHLKQIETIENKKITSNEN